MLFAEYTKALKNNKKHTDIKENFYNSEILNKSNTDMKSLARENSERRIFEKLRVTPNNIGNFSLSEWKT
jgi:hypothetical protein